MEQITYNPNMRLRDENHLAIARAFHRPGVATFLPRAFLLGNRLPGWENTEGFFLATPRIGAKFLECTLEIAPDGGSVGRVENEFENYMFVLEGEVELNLQGRVHTMEKEGFFWAPEGVDFAIRNRRGSTARLVWVRKHYVGTPYFSVPQPIVSSLFDIPGTQGTEELEQQCLPYDANRGFDMGMNMMSFAPGVTFPCVETHIIEHGNYFVSGRGMISINGRYYEVFPDDFCYVAPFTPHTACGLQPEPMRYLLFKCLNREFTL